MYLLERACTMLVRTFTLAGTPHPTAPAVIDKNAALAQGGEMSTIADKLAWPALLRKSTCRPELWEVTAAANLPCARRCAQRTRTCRSLCPLNSSSCAQPGTRPLSGSRQNESVVQRTVVLPPHPYLFCGTLLPRRRLKLGYLVQEDGEQVRGGLVSGAAGLIGLHCLPK